MARSEYYGCGRRLVRIREPMMKTVGKPDAGNRHVRFDERGWETGRHLVSTRAHPRLYLQRALARLASDFLQPTDVARALVTAASALAPMLAH